MSIPEFTLHSVYNLLLSKGFRLGSWEAKKLIIY